jgi:hypothetical protein
MQQNYQTSFALLHCIFPPAVWTVEHYASVFSHRIILYKCCLTFFFCSFDLMQGWVIIRDAAPLIEAARSVVTQLRWDARVLDLDIASDEKLLVCQKPFLRK